MSILLAAGGTGGHVFPAFALAEVLQKRGLQVDLATDERSLFSESAFPARTIYKIPSATPRQTGFASKFCAAVALGRGLWASLRLLRRVKPAVVIGFGGYPSVPPLLAAIVLRIPTIVHEQNAVLGQANRFLAAYVRAIALGFPDLAHLPPNLRKKMIYTGTPVRPAVLQAALEPYPTDPERLSILVTGGSQGARVFSQIVPLALALLSAEERARLILTMQTRAEELDEAKKALAALSIAHELAPFFTDLPARIAKAEWVIARAGASTISELAVIGRASLLVPYPYALDHDQAVNAAFLAQKGAAEIVLQPDFTPQNLAASIRHALTHRAQLQSRGQAAKALACVDAAERLADLVERVKSA